MGRIKWFDAIRALGLFLVLGYHLFYNNFPGGFLGVDIFFTFSGFLICASMLEEVRTKGSFDIISFFKRRFTRIYPPLFLSVAFTLPFLLFISPDFSVDVFKQTAAALGFVTNWYEIQTGGSYEGQLIPHLYIHTWFLAVEMQFYIVWGLICAALSALTGRIFKNNPEMRIYYMQMSVLIVSFFVSAASFLYMRVLHEAGGDLSAVYFNTFARLFPFFLGAAAAVLIGERDSNKRLPRHLRAVTAAAVFFTVSAGLAIIIFAVKYKFTDDFIYHYGFLCASLTTVALILGTRALHTLTPGVKQPAALTVTADLSFDIYLYHWPVYIILSALIANNYLASVVTLAASAGMSALMLYGAERVFKPAKDERGVKLKKTAFAFTAAALAVSLPAGAAVIKRAPDITSIEKDFAVSYIYQGVEEIKSIKRGVDAINNTPVVLLGFGFPRPDFLTEPIGPTHTQYNKTQIDEDVVYEPDKKLFLNKTQEPDQEPEQVFEPENTASEPVDTMPEPEIITEPDDMRTPEPANTGPDETPPEPEVTEPEETAPEPVSEPDIEAEEAPTPEIEPEWETEPEETTPSAVAFTPPPAPRTEPLFVTGGVTIIGDSVVLGAQATCIKIIPDCYVDALVSRQINTGRDLMLNMQTRKELREYVVIALGTNGHYNYAALFTQIIESLDPGHRLIFVTPFDGRANENAKITAATAAWLRDLPDQYEFVTIADWNALIGSQTNLLAGDKVHMGGQTSMTLYAEMIVEAIEAAAQKPAKE